MDIRLIIACSVIALMIVAAVGFAWWLIRERQKEDRHAYRRRAHRLSNKRQDRSHGEVHQRQIQQEAEHNGL